MRNLSFVCKFFKFFRELLSSIQLHRRDWDVVRQT